MRILITGVCGFIFSNFIKKVCSAQFPAHTYIGVDRLDRTENVFNMFEHTNYKFYLADITDAHIMDRIFDEEKPDVVIHGAAQSNVDNSITSIFPFLQSNIIGTQVIVDQCLKYNVELIHISTDEVYGEKHSINEAPWTETDPLFPRNPYAASKASAEQIVRAAHFTHGLKYKMTRSCNVFGPNQKTLNLVPHIITSLSNKAPIRIHGNGLNFRQYVSVFDKIAAIMTVLEEGKNGETYNIGADNYLSNLEMVNVIAEIMNTKPTITFIPDRKGHDFGYSVSSKKLRQLGWMPEENFYKAMVSAVKHYCDKGNK